MGCLDGCVRGEETQPPEAACCSAKYLEETLLSLPLTLFLGSPGEPLGPMLPPPQPPHGSIMEISPAPHPLPHQAGQP